MRAQILGSSMVVAVAWFALATPSRAMDGGGAAAAALQSGAVLAFSQSERGWDRMLGLPPAVVLCLLAGLGVAWIGFRRGQRDGS
ncbi:MAG: hypothetical protein ACFBSD_07220 [Paracoccaceae bacterium]